MRSRTCPSFSTASGLIRPRVLDQALKKPSCRAKIWIKTCFKPWHVWTVVLFSVMLLAQTKDLGWCTQTWAQPSTPLSARRVKHGLHKQRVVRALSQACVQGTHDGGCLASRFRLHEAICIYLSRICGVNHVTPKGNWILVHKGLRKDQIFVITAFVMAMNTQPCLQSWWYTARGAFRESCGEVTPLAAMLWSPA